MPSGTKRILSATSSNTAELFVTAPNAVQPLPAAWTFEAGLPENHDDRHGDELFVSRLVLFGRDIDELVTLALGELGQLFHLEAQ